MYQFPDRHSDVIAIMAALTADNTPAAIDLAGYECAQILIGVGIQGVTFTTTDKIEIKLRKGETSTAADHTAVTSADVIMPSGLTFATGGIIRNLNAAHAAATFYAVDYINQDPASRYISILADFSGTHGAATALAVVVRRLRHRLNPPA